MCRLISECDETVISAKEVVLGGRIPGTLESKNWT